MTYPRLTEENYTLAGNHESFARMVDEEGMMGPHEHAEMFDEFVAAENAKWPNDKNNWDAYHMSGDMINAFMLTHPKLKEAWATMTGDEKWITVEVLHYGIESFLKHELKKADRS